MFLAPWSTKPVEKKNHEPELGPKPLQKKTGAGAAKNMQLLYRLLEDKKKSIRKLYISYSSLGKIVSFMVKNTTIVFVLYFLQFHIRSLWGIKYFTKELRAARSRMFLAPWSRSCLKKKN